MGNDMAHYTGRWVVDGCAGNSGPCPADPQTTIQQYVSCDCLNPLVQRNLNRRLFIDHVIGQFADFFNFNFDSITIL